MGAIRLGVLDLYRDSTGMLSDHELAEALCYADAATTILLHLQAQDSADDLDPKSIQVIEDRAEVHQATGMIAVHAEVTLAQALVLLRARSYASERPIMDVARDVLAGVVRFGIAIDGSVREQGRPDQLGQERKQP